MKLQELADRKKYLEAQLASRATRPHTRSSFLAKEMEEERLEDLREEIGRLNELIEIASSAVRQNEFDSIAIDQVMKQLNEFIQAAKQYKSERDAAIRMAELYRDNFERHRSDLENQCVLLRHECRRLQEANHFIKTEIEILRRHQKTVLMNHDVSTSSSATEKELSSSICRKRKLAADNKVVLPKKSRLSCNIM